MAAPRPADPASGWIIVAAAIVVIGLGVGALFSLAVFLKPMQDSMGWSRAAISGVALWMWVIYGIGSLMWGVLADRWGARRVVIAGGALLGLGLVASSRITALWQLYAAFGGLVGVAAGAFYAPLTTTATRWFTANRGLAVALVSAGTGLGTFVVAPLTRWLISGYDWRVAMLVLGDLVWLVIIPLGFLVREAPRQEAGAADPNVPLGDVARSPQFWLIALTHFTCCLAHSGPIVVQGQRLGLIHDIFRVQKLDAFCSGAVQPWPLAVQQAVVDGLLCQNVAKGIRRFSGCRA